MSSENEETIRALIEKARRALSDAEVLLENGSAEATRAYYAVFSATRAALLTKEETPSTHAGLIRRFGYHFVRTERVSEEVGGILTTAESMRGEADYDVFSDFERSEAVQLVEEAERFVNAVEEKILQR
jgi:uncharacterized protein (UPF0332 family)